LATFIDPKPAPSQVTASSQTEPIANLVVQPIGAAPSLSLSPEALPLSVPQLIGNLFRRTENIRVAFRLNAPSIAVVAAANPCASDWAKPSGWSRWTYKSAYGDRTLALGQCTGLWRSDAALPRPIGKLFQVRVNQQIVAEVPTQADAEKIARRLHQVLRQPEFTPHALVPAITAGMPVGKAGNAALFWIAPEWAALLDRNPELIAIDWINHLRQALNAPTLSLADAQSQMHGLLPTTQQIRGSASWYGPYFHGRLTATGEVFDQHQLTAAHPVLPFNTYLKVTNLLTHQTVIVRINDRGPYFADRSLDLSKEAARSLGSEWKGVVPYEAVVMQKTELAQLQPTWAASQAVKPQKNWAKQLLARY
jgi:hypothetical protein